MGALTPLSPLPEFKVRICRPDISPWVTGNTGIDAVLQAAGHCEQAWYPDHPGRILLLTTHRRENWGDPQRRIAEAAKARDEVSEAALA